MPGIFDNLEPKELWSYFEEICQIPRPSKKEERIAKYLIEFANKNNLECETDDIGNVLISKPASKGLENLRATILQSHMDMVGEKNSDKNHDFKEDSIMPIVDGEWIRADGTTLGADDGIGIAAQLAVLASKDIAHGPIECLFTMDEETGLTGAFGLKEGFFKSKILINLDSEDWGELFIGCAGGRDTRGEFTYKKENVPPNSSAFKISVTGLKGGHSGDEIHKGLGNSIKIINRVIRDATMDLNVRISSINGGNARNAIPREAFATVTVPGDNGKQFIELVEGFNLIVKNELAINAPDLTIIAEKIETPDFIIDKHTQNNLIASLYACPHGEIAWSPTIPDLVETSTNLATIKTNETIEIGTSQRSSVESALQDIVNMVQSVFILGGANVESTSGYPGWEPNLDSEILEITKRSYVRLFSVEPEVKAIHAGLECGLIGKKYPDIDMISVGPTIKGAHTPEERLDIKTTQEFWALLLDVLKNIPGNR